VRILHLIDPASPGGGPSTLRLAAEALPRLPRAQHDVLIVGNGRHLDLARRCGLDPCGRLGAPLNRARMAAAALRSFLRAWERQRGRYDLLHAWTLPSAGLARLVADRRPVLAGAMVSHGACRSGRGLRLPAGLRRRRPPVLAATPVVRAELTSAGWPPELVSVLPPAADAETISPEQRVLLRGAWGADETTFVVALLGEPAAWADGRFAISVMGRVALTGKDVRLLLHPRATSESDLRRWLDKLGIGGFVVIDDAAAEPWRIAAGLDAALVASRRGSQFIEPAVAPILWAMAGGVPVVAPTAGGGSGLIEEGITGLLYRAGDYNRAAARVLELYDDARGAARLGAAARASVERRHGVDAYADRLGAVYEQCAGGRSVHVPEPEPETSAAAQACSGSSSVCAASK
jgi:glycosyltransferase involved in cell wall biosynthesis